MSVHGSIVSVESPYKKSIPIKNKGKNTSDISIKEKEIIQVPDNPSKRAKYDSIPYVEKLVPKNTSTILK